MTAPVSLHRYSSCGILLTSDLAIPEFARVQSGDPDYRVRVAASQPNSAIDDSPPAITWQNGTCIFQWRDLGRYILSREGSIEVEPIPEAREDLLRVPLIGVVLSMALQMQGRRVLHASAVKIGEGAVVFIGDKGYGKSTTAAALHARGYQIITDDVLVIASAIGDRPTTMPGPAGLKLWPDVAEVLGYSEDRTYPLYEGSTKRVLKVEELSSESVIPIQRIYILGGGDEVAIHEMNRRDALVELMKNSIMYRCMRDQDGVSARLLAAYADLARHVPVQLLIRTAALDGLAELARAVEEDVLG